MYLRSHKYVPESLNKLMEGRELDKIELQRESEEREELARKSSTDAGFLKVQKALLDLPAKYQLVLSLRFLEEKSIPEISQIIEKKEGTVRSQLSRGLELARKKLANKSVILDWD